MQGLYVDPHFEFAPCVRSESVGNESSEDAVKVEEEPIDELGWSVSEHDGLGGGQLTQIHTISSITQVLYQGQQCWKLDEGGQVPVERSSCAREEIPRHAASLQSTSMSGAHRWPKKHGQL